MALNTEKTKAITSGFYWMCAVAVIFTWVVVGNSPSHKITCVDKVIPYSSSTVDDPTLAVGTTRVTTEGINGTEHICQTGTGTVKEDVTTTYSVNEVVSRGTEQPAALYAAPVRSSGCEVTLCADGSCSFSTGRGTCSHHGGEAY